MSSCSSQYQIQIGIPAFVMSIDFFLCIQSDLIIFEWTNSFHDIYIKFKKTKLV